MSRYRREHEMNNIKEVSKSIHLFAYRYETRTFIVLFADVSVGPYPDPPETGSHSHGKFICIIFNIILQYMSFPNEFFPSDLQEHSV